MCNKEEDWLKLNTNNISGEPSGRYVNPSDINIPAGYQIDLFAEGLNAPSSFVFDEEGSLLIAESGLVDGNARILRLRNGSYEIVAEGFRPSFLGVNFYRGDIYVSHKGYITAIKPDGTLQNILMGLPSNGDYGNSCVSFGPDRKMYFGQGTTTNSGVVGLDNDWIYEYPFVHDSPGEYILLNGQNFATVNILELNDGIAYTGAYSPFGSANIPYEIRKGTLKASGSILRANPDGSELELVAWGFRFPYKVRFDHAGRLYVSNQSFSNRGSRPIMNAPDEFLLVTSEKWYGWPDFAAGEPVTNAKFTPEGRKPVEFLLASHPNIPDRPFALFPPDSAISGFDFCYDSNFGPYGNAYIAEFGSGGYLIDNTPTPYAGVGHRISQIDMRTGEVSTFAINKSGYPSFITGEGGMGRPIDVLFGPDKAMYILDFAVSPMHDPDIYLANTGVIWRITRT